MTGANATASIFCIAASLFSAVAAVAEDHFPALTKCYEDADEVEGAPIPAGVKRKDDAKKANAAKAAKQRQACLQKALAQAKSEKRTEMLFLLAELIGSHGANLETAAVYDRMLTQNKAEKPKICTDERLWSRLNMVLGHDAAVDAKAQRVLVTCYTEGKDLIEKWLIQLGGTPCLARKSICGILKEKGVSGPDLTALCAPRPEETEANGECSRKARLKKEEKKEPGSAAGPEEPAPSDDPAPAPANDEERVWRAKVDKEVAAHEDARSSLVNECGHDIEVTMDWKGFSPATWQGTSPSGFCTGDLLSRLAEKCGDTDFKDKAVAITKVVCHYKPCAEVTFDEGPVSKYVLGKDRTRIDNCFCEKSGISSHHAGWWLAHHL